jgi:hypothetical protein
VVLRAARALLGDHLRDYRPARLARAVHLDAEPQGAGTWRVIGGAAAHVVTMTAAGATVCDCRDSAVHAGRCKHRLAVALLALDADARAVLRELVPLPTRPPRHRTGPPPGAPQKCEPSPGDCDGRRRGAVR